jgi:hypothetical protein
MSEHGVAAPDLGELKELTQLLLILFEAAKRLPKGPERASALEVIDSFQKRLATLIRRAQVQQN